MRLYWSRIRKKASQVILRDRPPIRSLAAVVIVRGCPKFSDINSLEGTNQVIGSLREIENQFLPRKSFKIANICLRGNESIRTLSKTSEIDNGLSRIA